MATQLENKTKTRKCSFCSGQQSTQLKFRSSFIEEKKVLDLEEQLAVLAIVFRDDFEFVDIKHQQVINVVNRVCDFRPDDG